VIDKNKTVVTFYTRLIGSRWEVWSSIEYVVKSAWRQTPFNNFVCECVDEVEATKTMDRLNNGEHRKV